MENPELEYALIEAAEVMERKASPALLKIRKENYNYCKSLGLSDDSIRKTMGLTTMQMREMKTGDLL